MDASVWTRHATDCEKKANRFSRQCNCPKWLYWRLDGKEFRVSARTRSWEKATKKARAVEIEHEQKLRGERPASGPVTIEDAIEAYLSEKRVEGRSEETVYKLKVLLEKQLLVWSREQGLHYLLDLDVEHLRRFRQALASGTVSLTQNQKNSSESLKKKHERLIGFFYFAGRQKWISENPAADLTRIKSTVPPTDYFPAEQMQQITDATYVYDRKAIHAKEMVNNATRLRTLVLLLRWSGLGLSDAVSLERSRLSADNNLFLYRHKTGVPVHVKLPDFVAQALRSITPGPTPTPL